MSTYIYIYIYIYYIYLYLYVCIQYIYILYCTKRYTCPGGYALWATAGTC